jgi:hypothetical protein
VILALAAIWLGILAAIEHRKAAQRPNRYLLYCATTCILFIFWVLLKIAAY